jgi:hypothetical protein
MAWALFGGSARLLRFARVAFSVPSPCPASCLADLTIGVWCPPDKDQTGHFAKKEQLTNTLFPVYVSFVTHEHPSSPQADPASHDPSGARPANCTCCGGARQPDPTDDFIVMLKEYAQLGMRLARVAVARAEEADASPAAAPAEPAVAAEDPESGKRAAERRNALKSADLAYSRAGRSMRLSMSLAIKFHGDRLERDKQIVSAEAKAERQRKERRKGQLQRLATDAIKRHTEREIERQLEAEEIDEVDEEAKEEALDSLYEALSERLDEEDIERDLDIYPTSELFGRICQDLGIEPDWERLRRAFWALEEIRRNVPGSRFARPRRRKRKRQQSNRKSPNRPSPKRRKRNRKPRRCRPSAALWTGCATRPRTRSARKRSVRRGSERYIPSTQGNSSLAFSTGSLPHAWRAAPKIACNPLSCTAGEGGTHAVGG